MHSSVIHVNKKAATDTTQICILCLREMRAPLEVPCLPPDRLGNSFRKEDPIALENLLVETSQDYNA